MRPIILVGGLAAALVCRVALRWLRKSAACSGSTIATIRPAPRSRGGDQLHRRAVLSVFNNLVIYDQSKLQNSPQSIVPDLAKSWSLSADARISPSPCSRA
jgi:peptide/nickel transport system substrate-binding protein